jgi:uncharacterized protein YecE (DUF72 family)
MIGFCDSPTTSYCAQYLDPVEIDSTFYATLNVSVERSWNAKAQRDFFLRQKYHRRSNTRESSRIVMRR